MLIRSYRKGLGFSTTLLGADSGRAAPVAAAAKRIGLSGVEIGATLSADPAERLAAEFRKEGIEALALRAPTSDAGGACDPGAADLAADPRPEEARKAIRLLEMTAAFGRQLRCCRVVLRPGLSVPPEATRAEEEARRIVQEEGLSGKAREALSSGLRQVDLLRVPYLERAIRALWDLCGRHPDITFCLETPDSAMAMPDAEALGLILDELKRRNVAYWHDTGFSHVREVLGIEPQDEWLERFGRVMAGVHLHDAAGLVHGLPPGTGDVDFRRVRESLPNEAARILNTSPAWSLDIAEMAASELRKAGL